MKRREFLATTAVASTIGLAGCSTQKEAPPRESEVFEAVQVSSNALTVHAESEPLVQTRMQEGTASTSEEGEGGTDTENTSGENDTQSSLSGIAGVLGSISPVGVASAAKGGRGRGVPRSNGKVVKGRNGRVKWRGGTYAVWWNDHEDEVKTITPVIAGIGVAQLAKPSADEDSLPGPGKPPEGWDETWTKEEYQGENIQYEGIQAGWFRVGGHLVDQDSDRDLGWEAVDLKVTESDTGDGYEVERKWKVSPSL